MFRVFPSASLNTPCMSWTLIGWLYKDFRNQDYPLLSRLHSRLVFKDLYHEAAEAHVEALGELVRRALRVIPQEVELHRAM